RQGAKPRDFLNARSLIFGGIIDLAIVSGRNSSALIHLSLTATTDAVPGDYEVPFEVFDLATPDELSGAVHYHLGRSPQCVVRPNSELFVTDLSVVEDPVRTSYEALPTDPKSGAWTFGRLLERMARTPEAASDLAESLFGRGAEFPSRAASTQSTCLAVCVAVTITSAARLSWLIRAVTLATFGCSTSATEPVPLPRTLRERAGIPAGRTFDVRLENGLSSAESSRPQVFRAALLLPLESPDGTLVAPVGALVRGHVETGDRNTAVLRLCFDSIETVHGPRPLFAHLASEQGDATLRASVIAGPGAGYDALVGLEPPRSREAIGGGPRDPGEVRSGPVSEIVLRLDTGTAMRLILGQALLDR
ncbi:MAG TPA: hypothetical protein VJT73_20380, partial [Polyangiaceae bacterium]|nr:hypothetical protein [Polyangiaceae bacterium]